MKMTMQVNGREKIFTEQELKNIVHQYFLEKKTDVLTKQIAQTLIEDHYVEVKPQEIDKTLFQHKKRNPKHEEVRKIILEAFKEMENNPEKYGKNFTTIVAKKTWIKKSVKEIKEVANALGDHNADWVEQALEWAQRIANGEKWQIVCHFAEPTDWFRLVIWKNGRARLIGNFKHENLPYTQIGYGDYEDSFTLHSSVPLIVVY